jgi:hypothetical protein
MGELELAIMNGKKEGHKAIMAAIAERERLGYLLRGIEVNDDGALKITCYPPPEEEGNNQG